MKRLKFNIDDIVIYHKDEMTIVARVVGICVYKNIGTEYMLTTGDRISEKELQLYHTTENIPEYKKNITANMASDEDVFNVGDNVLLYTGQIGTIIPNEQSNKFYKIKLYNSVDDDFYIIDTTLMKKLPNDIVKFLNSFKDEQKFKKGDYVKYNNFENVIYGIIEEVVFDELTDGYYYKLDNGIVVRNEKYLIKLDD